MLDAGKGIMKTSTRLYLLFLAGLLLGSSGLFFVSMKHLGPYKKYIIAAAVIQCIIVIVGGYYLFKYSAMKNSMEHEAQEKPRLEEPLKTY